MGVLCSLPTTDLDEVGDLTICGDALANYLLVSHYKICLVQILYLSLQLFSYRSLVWTFYSF